MDKPSCAMAVVGAAVATLVFGGAFGPHAQAVEEMPALGAPGVAAPGRDAGSGAPPPVVVECARPRSVRNTAPAVVPPAGPSDVQINASGTGAAGGAGTVPGDSRGDPCAPVKRFSHAKRAASAAAIDTPTSLNRR